MLSVYDAPITGNNFAQVKETEWDIKTLIKPILKGGVLYSGGRKRDKDKGREAEKER